MFGPDILNINIVIFALEDDQRTLLGLAWRVDLLQTNTESVTTFMSQLIWGFFQEKMEYQ